MSTPVVDAHHHFWRYSPEAHGWIDPQSMGAIARDFGPDDLAAEASAAGVDAVVSVQAEQTTDETRWLLELAEASPLIAGVVGWAPLSSEDCASQLASLAHPLLKGVRHIVQDEPDDEFLLGEAFNAGISELTKLDLVYDILIFHRHLSVATRFVDRHPGQRFVLDHIAKPAIKASEIEPWRAGLATLAERPNVVCKISGMTTEADWSGWTPDTLKPYWDAALEAFGPHRLMFGSDWPVCLLASGYKQWKDVVGAWASGLSESEKSALFGGVAIKTYRLELETVKA